MRFGPGVDISVANPFQMREHGNARLFLHARHQRFAATRHDHVDGPVKPLEHHADGGAIRARRDLDGVGGQAGVAQAGAERRANRGDAIGAIGARAQDQRIARAQRQRPGLGGDIRAAFENHADDADRHAHAGDAQTVRAGPFGERFSDRIGQRGDGFDALRHRLQARFVEREAIEQAFRQVFGVRAGHILGIGGEDVACRRAQPFGHRLKRRCACVGSSLAHRRRRRAGAQANGMHLGAKRIRGGHGHDRVILPHLPGAAHARSRPCRRQIVGMHQRRAGGIAENCGDSRGF